MTHIARNAYPRHLVLDAGALIKVDRNERALLARLYAASSRGISLRTTGVIIAQVWRDASRQTNLAHFLRGVHIVPVDEQLGREAGTLIARASGGEAADASLVAVSAPGDVIITGDVDDITKLVTAASKGISVIRC